MGFTSLTRDRTQTSCTGSLESYPLDQGSFWGNWRKFLSISCIIECKHHAVIISIKKAECQRIDAFELWGWRRFLRVPSTARRSNQSILKEISPEYSLEGLMLEMKFQYFGHAMWRTDSLEKTLKLGKIEGGRRRGQQRVRWLDGNHWLNGREFE